VRRAPVLLAVGFVLLGPACDRPSQKSLDAYRAAQAAALEREAAQEKAFEASIGEVRAGKWTPRADLGRCAADLPPPTKDEGEQYPGWVMDDPNPDGVAGWGHLAERVFKDERESLGAADAPAPDGEKDVVAETARLRAYDPAASKPVLFLFVDEVNRPVQKDEKTFAGGDERGRAWVWDPKTKTVVCASTFASKTPNEVLVKFFSRDADRDAMVASNLMLSLRRNSLRSAATGLVAAGAPR